MAVAQAAHSYALSPKKYIMRTLGLDLDPGPGYKSQQHCYQYTVEGPEHPTTLLLKKKKKKMCLQEFDSDNLPYCYFTCKGHLHHSIRNPICHKPFN